VVSVDHAPNTITVDATVPAEACVGQVAILGNDLHQTSYTVRAVRREGDRTILEFGDTLFTVGLARLTEIDQNAGTVATDTQLTGYGRVDGGRHQGRWLYNEDKTKGLHIESFEGGKFRLTTDGQDLASIFTDANGDGRALLWLSDIGPGDTFRLPSVTSLQRKQPGLYDIQMTTEVCVEVPRGNGGG